MGVIRTTYKSWDDPPSRTLVAEGGGIDNDIAKNPGQEETSKSHDTNLVPNQKRSGQTIILDFPEINGDFPSKTLPFQGPGSRVFGRDLISIIEQRSKPC